ncbi:MAG: helix-turn-helix transcriptional regulator [Chloroflexi bacterium]|nr:helix-turn-helix transcriptional regulator [Chloroflexota bacterium]
MADLATARRQAFGQRVRALRLDRGWSQEDLAEAAAVHRTYVSSLERGQRNVAIDNIWRLADALGVHPGELLVDAPRRRR